MEPPPPRKGSKHTPCQLTPHEKKTGAAGSPEIVVDNRQALADALAASNAEETSGCGCTHGGAGGWLAWPLLATLLRRRTTG